MQCIDITTVTEPPPAPATGAETFQVNMDGLARGEVKAGGSERAPSFSEEQPAVDPLKRTKNRSFALAMDAGMLQCHDYAFFEAYCWVYVAW
jgi:hypothetical protein